MKNRIYIGIDPAFREGGFCACIIDENRELAIKSFKDGFLSFSSWLLYDVPESAAIAVENSNLQNKLFSNYKGNHKTKVSIALSVGKNMAASQYTADLCRLKVGKENYFDISPQLKGAKLNQSQAERLAIQYKIKGWPKRTSQDARDAFKLAVMALKFANRRL